MNDIEAGLLTRTFATAAGEMGRYHAANDANRDEFASALARLDSAYEQLAAGGRQSALSALLSNDDLFVRLYAAKMLLLSDEGRAISVLQDLQSRNQPTNLSVNAYRILTHWRMGVLFPRRSAVLSEDH